MNRAIRAPPEVIMGLPENYINVNAISNDPYYNLGSAIIMQAIKDRDVNYFESADGRYMCRLLGIEKSIDEIIRFILYRKEPIKRETKKFKFIRSKKNCKQAR